MMGFEPTIWRDHMGNQTLIHTSAGKSQMLGTLRTWLQGLKNIILFTPSLPRADGHLQIQMQPCEMTTGISEEAESFEGE